jgi:RimJ/RimL family protein N-acetyltransferase
LGRRGSRGTLDGVIVRPATPDDVEALVDVQERGAVLAFAHIFPQDAYPFPRARIVARWREEIADAGTRVYVATDEAGAVTGFAATRGSVLLHFGTAVETWGTGHAREFHDALLDTIAGTAPGGTTRVRLHVLEANGRARRFYEKLAWRPTGAIVRSPFPPHPVLVEYDREL